MHGRTQRMKPAQRRRPLPGLLKTGVTEIFDYVIAARDQA
jgi:hypothetical protein